MFIQCLVQAQNQSTVHVITAQTMFTETCIFPAYPLLPLFSFLEILFILILLLPLSTFFHINCTEKLKRLLGKLVFLSGFV